MARIQGVTPDDAGPMMRFLFRFMRREMTKMTGREPARGDGLEPLQVWARQPKMLMAQGRFQNAVRKGRSVDERLKMLVEAKGAQLLGCEYCLDLGSQIARNSGFSDEELLALIHHRDSDLFTEREKVAMDFAVAVTRTPVEVDDELFAQLREHFTDEQLVELAAMVMVANLHRFNAAFDIGSAGFSEGMVCVPPQRAAAPSPVASAA